MTTKTYTIRTAKNVWQFDVSLPTGGVPKVMRTYGDVTNREALDDALVDLQKRVEADIARTKSGAPGKRGREALYPEYIRGVQKPRGRGYWIVVETDKRRGGYKAGDMLRFNTKTKAADTVKELSAQGVTFEVKT
jgi:hypothetical protein